MSEWLTNRLSPIRKTTGSALVFFLQQLFLRDGFVLHLGDRDDQVDDLLFIDRRAHLGGGIASIGSDHEQGGRLMAQMLVNTGAHHVVMIGGPRDQFFDLAARNGDSPDDFDLHKTTFPAVRYYLTLEQELKAAGVRYEYVEAGNVEDFQGYKNAVNAVLNSMPVDGVDAVVSSDIGAALCVREAMRRHISIPRDLQIIAYDGTYLTDLAGMKMTAVAQNFDKIAQVAVGNIVRAIAKEGDAKADTTSATGRKPYEPDVLIPVTRKLGDTTR